MAARRGGRTGERRPARRGPVPPGRPGRRPPGPRAPRCGGPGRRCPGRRRAGTGPGPGPTDGLVAAAVPQDQGLEHVQDHRPLQVQPHQGVAAGADLGGVERLEAGRGLGRAGIDQVGAAPAQRAEAPARQRSRQSTVPVAAHWPASTSMSPRSTWPVATPARLTATRRAGVATSRGRPWPWRPRTRTRRPDGNSSASPSARSDPPERVPVTTVPLPRMVNTRSTGTRGRPRSGGSGSRSRAASRAAASASTPTPDGAAAGTTAAPARVVPRSRSRTSAAARSRVAGRPGPPWSARPPQRGCRAGRGWPGARPTAAASPRWRRPRTGRSRPHPPRRACCGRTARGRGRRRSRPRGRTAGWSRRTRGRSSGPAPSPRPAGPGRSRSGPGSAPTCRGRHGRRCR